MSNESDAQAAVRNAGRGWWAGRRVGPFAPGARLAIRKPLEQAARSVRNRPPRIVKMLAVEMIGHWSAIEGHPDREPAYFSAATALAGGVAGAPVARAGAQGVTETPPEIMPLSVSPKNT